MYGVVPLVAGIVFTCVSGWLAMRRSGRTGNGGTQPETDIVSSIAKSFGFAVVGVVVVFIVLCLKDLVVSRSFSPGM
jgi:hypothetical protein